MSIISLKQIFCTALQEQAVPAEAPANSQDHIAHTVLIVATAVALFFGVKLNM